MTQTTTPYDNRSREELLIALSKADFSILKLQHELDQLKRLVFGSRHERFESSLSKEQLTLGLNMAEPEQPQITSVQTIAYTRAKTHLKEKTPTAGRMKLPGDLPREKIIIKPEEDVTGFREIGKEVTEELEYTPGKFFVREIIRPKYARPQPEVGKPGIVIGTLPSRIIEKGIIGPGLLTQIIIDKYLDHLPLHRQMERFKRMGINFSSSTMSDWVAQGCNALEVLFAVHQKLVLNSNYLQADETTIKVMDNNKKGKTHLGYYWVYRSPLENLVLFDYRPGRGGEGPKKLLKDFKGYLQTDGYDVYDYFGRQQDITQIGCMAHARRKFTDALDNDKQRCEHALTLMQKLYAIERKAKEENFTHEQRYELRQQESIPILKELEQWMKEQYNNQHVPKSTIGKAIAYSLRRWDKLCLYTTDGRLQIDNNLVENSIRPVAMGRKAYLFAGSHQAAQRAAMLYALLGTCKINGINPYDWLRDVFEKLPSYSINKIQDLLPHNWGTLMKNTIPTTS